MLRVPIGRLLVCALVSAGCEVERGAPREPAEAPATEDSIHLGSVTGKIDGQPFEVKTARYFIDTRRGYEKVDLQLIGSEAETPCGALKVKKTPSVWLRKNGAVTLEAETIRSTVADAGAPWEIHYQTVANEKHWVGTGEANTLLELSEPGPDLKVHGVLWTCFRDATASCVQGEFLASFCRLSIDEPVRGTAAMERPLAHLLVKDAGVGAATSDAGAR